MLDEIMVCGEPFDIDFEILENSLPKPIAGYSVWIELRKNSRSGDLIAGWSDASPHVTRIDADGLVQLKIPALITRDYDFNVAFTDLLLMKDNVGIRSELIKITLDRGATR